MCRKSEELEASANIINICLISSLLIWIRELRAATVSLQMTPRWREVLMGRLYRGI